MSSDEIEQQFANLYFYDTDSSDTENDNDELNQIILTKAIIYRIYNHNTTKCYIGSTSNMKHRWSMHRYDYRRFKATGFMNCKSSLIFDFGDNDTKYEVLTTFWVQNKSEVHIKEKYYINLYKEDIVNIANPHSTVEDKQKSYMKQRNKMRKKEPVLCCRCGSHVKRLENHMKSKKCFNNSLTYLSSTDE